jgi:hypothetical protein
VIVIGRPNDWEHEKLRALHGLNRRHYHHDLRPTHDAGRAFVIQMLRPNEEQPAATVADFDDDIPF